MTTAPLSCVLVFLMFSSLALTTSAHGQLSDTPQILKSLHLLIPGAAGGGWDRTARGTGEALTRSALVANVTFENRSGGGGSKGIAYLLERKNPRMLMVNSTPIVIRSLQPAFPQSYKDLIPVASIIGDYSVLVVRTQSPLLDLQGLAALLVANPRQIAIAGGSVSGGTDHIVAAMIFRGFGANPREVKYIPYDAGGKAMAGLLSGEVQALSSGYGEVVDLVSQGWVRILCIAAQERLSIAPDTPTCVESGAKDAVFVNWRGYFAAPGLTHAQLSSYQRTLFQMQKTEAWNNVRNRYGWVDLYKPGEEFANMLAQQETKLRTLLKELGFL